MKKIDNFEYIFYSDSLEYEKKFYFNMIYSFLYKLNYEYPNFKEWFYNLFYENYSLKINRQILLCQYRQRVVGVAILKKSEEENKICTLRVDKNFQKMSIGKNLMELSFEWLEDDKPLITIHKSKQKEFYKLFNYYNFKLEQKKWGHYSLFSTELVFNGVLPKKKYIIINKFELVNLNDIIRKSINTSNFNFNEILEQFIQTYETELHLIYV